MNEFIYVTCSGGSSGVARRGGGGDRSAREKFKPDKKLVIGGGGMVHLFHGLHVNELTSNMICNYVTEITKA